MHVVATRTTRASACTHITDQITHVFAQGLARSRRQKQRGDGTARRTCCKKTHGGDNQYSRSRDEAHRCKVIGHPHPPQRTRELSDFGVFSDHREYLRKIHRVSFLPGPRWKTPELALIDVSAPGDRASLGKSSAVQSRIRPKCQPRSEASCFTVAERPRPARECIPFR
jgi:hypothetical protein